MQANRRGSARGLSSQSANEYPTVEVVNMVQRRRRTLAEKIRIVAEASQPGMSVSYVARQYGIAPNLLFRWRKLMSEGGKVAVQADDQVVSAGEARALKKRVRDLERLLGKKTMEVEILKEALDIAREKNSSRVRRCPSKTIPDDEDRASPWRIPLSSRRAQG